MTRWTAHRRTSAGLATVFQTTPPLGAPRRPRERDGRVPPVDTDRVRRGDAARALAAERGAPHRGGGPRGARRSSGLDDALGRPAGSLPLGQLRLLAVARALAQRPRLLLLDEPAAGLRERREGAARGDLLALKQRGLTQILVEHDMAFVGSLADRVVVLDRGRVIADGTPAEVRAERACRRGVPGVGDAVTLLGVRDVVVRYGRPSRSTASRSRSGARACRADRAERGGEDVGSQRRVRRRSAGVGTCSNRGRRRHRGDARRRSCGAG